MHTKWPDLMAVCAVRVLRLVHVTHTAN